MGCSSLGKMNVTRITAILCEPTKMRGDRKRRLQSAVGYHSRGRLMVHRRGAGSWWDYSDSDTKYKINNTFNGRRSLQRPSEKRNGTFPMDFRVQSFGRKILILFITHACRIASAPPPKNNAAARSSHSSDRVQIIFVRSRSIASKTTCLRRDRRADRSSLIGEEPLDADLRHRECSECEATGPHRSGAGWDDVP